MAGPRMNLHVETLDSCDQMARLIFRYLAIFNNVNLPNSIKY